MAVAVAAAVPLFLRLEPRGGLRLLTPAELWLLGVFTLGVLALLSGLSVALGSHLGVRGAREGLEELKRRADLLEAEGGEGVGEPVRGEPPRAGETAPTGAKEAGTGAGGWLVQMGLGLLGLYTAGWLILG